MTPEQNLVFSDTLKDMIKNKEIIIKDTPELQNVRGISLKRSNRIFINLSARQWKALSDETLQVLIGQTIVHEHIHLLCKDYTSIDNSDYEEKICMLMAGQI